MYRISQIAKKYGLSRSTLLYYDRIGLLTPVRHIRSGYRIYSRSDCLRMEEISQLRNAGIPRSEIKKLLEQNPSRSAEILRKRLHHINAEISQLRVQQNFILNLLGDEELVGSVRVLSKAQWIANLRKAGLDEAGMDRWHAEFEATSPEAHQDFLESLNLPKDEIHLIRQRSRELLGLE